MERLDARARGEVAAKVRDDAWSRQAVQALAAVRRLYATQVSPTSTEHGYWHVHVRRGFNLPYFVEPAVRDPLLRSEPDGFCAIYYSLRDRQAPGGTSSGLPRALIRGAYNEGGYDAIDRALRVLTDEVLEPSRWKCNGDRGRLYGRVVGWVAGAGVVAASAACLLLLPASTPPALSWVLELPSLQRWGIGAAAGLLSLGVAGALVSEVLAALLGSAGAAVERWRLRPLDTACAAFLYNAEAADAVIREFAVVTQEEQKLREYQRLRAGGADMGREDFLKVYLLMPQVRQLAALERRRRDDAAALQRKLGEDFATPVMKLVEACLSEPAPGAPPAAG